MNKLGLNIPEQPSIPPLPKKKAAVNRQVIVTWFTPEEKPEGWYKLDYGFTELTVHAWCDLEPYEGY